MKKKTKILIAYDGSNCADAALDDLTHAGLPPNVEARILSVGELWLPPPPPSSYEIVQQARTAKSAADLQHRFAKGCPAAKEAIALAERARDRIKAIFPEWKVSADATCGSPASEILANAKHWTPDLIVVGSHGRTALGRFVLGSVSQRVLTEAYSSVRVSRGRVDEPNSPQRIIIGVDGSPSSEEAVRAVAARNWPAHSEVRLIVVDDPLVPDILGLIPPLGKMLEEDRIAERAWAKKISEQASAILEKSGIAITTELKEGEPKQELPKAAEEWSADCIFVGSGGFNNRLERFVLGSVSAAVAARAHCSVEVIRNSPSPRKRKQS